MNSTGTVEYQYGGNNIPKNEFQMDKISKCKAINLSEDSIREYLYDSG